MTPPRSECSASSKLHSLMGSQGISDGGVNDGVIWSLFAHLTLHAKIDVLKGAVKIIN
ncbi:hypothetical protein [Candidatus Methanodesulfokora washburnensis]|jgi:hypothetical protein|uniref:hypothetical protein n=1 Tax=Candidatus Methanodesulfokora washburnensis TaxID=2478471 RepID=UPI0013874049|nr:hypothetical protein [Candidatus Methanodesulfokores washburnensis]